MQVNQNRNDFLTGVIEIPKFIPLLILLFWIFEDFKIKF